MKALKAILIILVLVLLVEVGFLVYENYGDKLFATATEAPTTEMIQDATEAPTTEGISLELPPAVTGTPTEPSEEIVTEEPTTEAPTESATEIPTEEVTEAPTEIPTEAPTEAPTEEATEASTEETVEEPTEAEEVSATESTEVFLLTFAGNCTFGGDPFDTSSASFVNVVGDDYGYPFRNVEPYFQNDEFTFLTLEGVLADSGEAVQSGSVFRGPSAYAKILSTGSVDMVSLANDHTDDFGEEGYNSTKAALEAENISYVEKNNYNVFTTKNGLKIGVYAISVKYERWPMQQAINAMKKEGVDLIIVAFHWGEEASYAPNMTQINAAHAAIDNGADLVIGTNPQYLQGIEYYKHGLICYSLGNFSYGGSKWPKDMDSVIIQQEVIRDPNGNVSLGEAIFIPCSMTSSNSNNFQPTPLELDSWQYNSVLHKLTEPIWAPVYG